LVIQSLIGGGRKWGTLQVEGTLALNQFWPHGTSDGDTAQVSITRVTFDGTVTRALEGAHVRGRLSKPVIDARGAVTVRLQGIDAPELHYTPSVAKAAAKKPNADFRQPYGRAAAQSLGKYLHTLAGGPTSSAITSAGSGNGTSSLKCRVVTEVTTPNEVFDTYGRLIGDIVVTDRHGKDIYLNLWMAQKGWAFPTFYASMSASEIHRFRRATLAAQKNRRGIWAGYRPALSFGHALLYKDGADSSSNGADAGAVGMPKIFRRLAQDWVSKGNTHLHAFLTAESSSDRCYKTDELLEQGITVAQQYHLADLVTNAAVTFEPGDLVFLEAGSTLCDEHGRKIASW